MFELVGIGLYTPTEAERLTGVSASKIARWLRGHMANGKFYEPLWLPQVKTAFDEKLCLGFHDLMEVRVASAFIAFGISPHRVRSAIEVAREIYGLDHPLSTDRFRTDGKDIFIRVIEGEGADPQSEKLLDTLRRQYAFAEVLHPSLKGVEFDSGGKPALWWPKGRKGQIVIDPDRSFGQPIEAVSGVPTTTLANAARVEGLERAARLFEVPRASVKRALEFEDGLELRAAA